MSKHKRPEFSYKLRHLYSGKAFLNKCTDVNCPFFKVCRHVSKEILSMDSSDFESVNTSLVSEFNDGNIVSTIEHCPGMVPSTDIFIYDSLNIKCECPARGSAYKYATLSIVKNNEDGSVDNMIKFEADNGKIVVSSAQKFIKMKKTSFDFYVDKTNRIDMLFHNGYVFLNINGKEIAIKSIQLKGARVEILKNHNKFVDSLPFSQLEISLNSI